MAEVADRSVLTRVVVALVALIVVVGGIVWWRVATAPGIAFTGVFDRTVGIYPGSDVRALGVKIGKVDSVTPEGTTVHVSMHLDEGTNIAADTGAVIISPSLVSDRYVQLTKLWTSGPKLQGGSLIPLSRTATPVELDQLNESLIDLSTALGPKGANANGALSRLLDTGAANLRGNGTAINTTITKFSQASETLASNRDNLFATVDNLQKFTTMLARNDNSVAGLNNNLAAVSRVLAEDRTSFSAALKELGQALAPVQRFIADNRTLLTDNVRKLASIATTLVTERKGLAQALRAAPLAVDNLINAYDPAHNTLNGRADLNELTLWSKLGGGSSTTSSATSGDATSGDSTSSGGSTPLLLPSAGTSTSGGGS